MQTEALVRHLTLTGPANFRDIGGYSTTDGRHVRWRRLFRSDSLHHLTDADIDSLASQGIDIRLGMDLRTLRELEATGHGPAFERGGRHMHVPFVPVVTSIGPDRQFQEIGELYLHMIEQAHDCVRSVFEALGDLDSYPAVYYCSAGKDRTGMLTALILSTLEVSAEDIVSDYSLTDELMHVVLTERYERARQARLEREALEAAQGIVPQEPQPEGPRQSDPEILRARPQTMRAFLTALDERYGAAQGYLAACGVSEAQVEAIRAHLLD